MTKLALLVFLFISFSPAHAAPALSWDHDRIEGHDSGWDLDSIRTAVFTNQKDWAAYWQRNMGAQNGRLPPPVDFSRETVFGALLGKTPEDGYAITISSAEDSADPSHLIVAYWAQRLPDASSAAQAPKQPFVFIKFKTHKVIEVLNSPEPVTVRRYAGTVPAEAHATAAKGPVQITLRLYKEAIKQWKGGPFRKEQTLWYQIIVKNIGEQEFGLSDRIFWDPDFEARSRGYNFVIPEIRDARGKLLDWESYWPRGDDTHWEDGKQSVTDEQLDHLNDLQAQWRKQGLNGDQVLSKSQEYVTQAAASNAPKQVNHDRDRRIWLMPGGSIRTPAWSFWDDKMDALANKPRPDPVGGFARLMGYSLPPGKYRIRAKFGHALSRDELSDYKKLHIPAQPGDVTVATPDIEFEVAP